MEVGNPVDLLPEHYHGGAISYEAKVRQLLRRYGDQPVEEEGDVLREDDHHTAPKGRSGDHDGLFYPLSVDHDSRLAPVQSELQEFLADGHQTHRSSTQVEFRQRTTPRCTRGRKERHQAGEFHLLIRGQSHQGSLLPDTLKVRVGKDRQPRHPNLLGELRTDEGLGGGLLILPECSRMLVHLESLECCFTWRV